MPIWNLTSNVLERLPGDQRGLVALTSHGLRREWTFAELAAVSSRFAGGLQDMGVRKGDVVLTFMGNTPDWVFTLVACWRIGAVAMPCNTQLTQHDLAKRIEMIGPKLCVVDAPRGDAFGFDAVAADSLAAGAAVPAEPLGELDPALVIFTSGTAGEAKPVRHGQRYLANQHIQAEHWFGARPGDLCWCTAASGWSKSSRNAFVAAWVRGAAALVHDGRFEPAERLDIVERERVNVLCMAPTEYRAIAKRTTL